MHDQRLRLVGSKRWMRTELFSDASCCHLRMLLISGFSLEVLLTLYLRRVAQMMKRMDGRRWTSQLDQSMTALCEHPEGPGDVVLMVLARLRLLSAEVSFAHCTWPFGNSVYTAQPQSLSPQYLDMLLSQLEQLWCEIPADLANNGMLHHEEPTSPSLTRFLIIHSCGIDTVAL